MAFKNVDMSVKPLSMIIRQINHDNDITLTEERVRFGTPEVMPIPELGDIRIDGAGYTICYNTKLKVYVLDSDVPDDHVVVKYERVSLKRLFLLNDPTLYEVDILHEGRLSINDVWAAILNKYKMLADDESFTLELAEDFTTLKLTAKPENLAYIDSVTFKLEPALSRRIVHKVLDGFVIPKAIPLNSLNSKIDLTPMTIKGKVNAATYMPLVFTNDEAQIIKNVYKTKDISSLVKLLTTRSGDVWSSDASKDYTLNGAVVDCGKNNIGTYLTVKLDDSQNTKIFGTLQLQTDLDTFENDML